MQLSEQEVVRREKLALRELGINPYPADLYPLDTNSSKIKQNFEESKKGSDRRKINVSSYTRKSFFANCKILKEEFKFTSTEMRSVQEKTKLFIMKCTRNYLI